MIHADNIRNIFEQTVSSVSYLYAYMYKKYVFYYFPVFLLIL